MMKKILFLVLAMVLSLAVAGEAVTPNKGKGKSKAVKVTTPKQTPAPTRNSGHKSGASTGRHKSQGTPSQSQARPVVETPEPETPTKPITDNKIYTAVDQMPEFPGGQATFINFISSNLRYPAAAAENNIQGKVYVKFVVTSTGKVDKVQIARSVDKALDQEALRVCRMLPDFIPGRLYGQPVNVWYTAPVTFKIQ